MFLFMEQKKKNFTIKIKKDSKIITRTLKVMFVNIVDIIPYDTLLYFTSSKSSNHTKPPIAKQKSNILYAIHNK